jgi:hypothetical protein
MHMLRLTRISIDLVLGISQLDDPPHYLLLCTRMVCILSLLCRGDSLTTLVQQADNSHRPDTIRSHRYRDHQSTGRVQTQR